MTDNCKHVSKIKTSIQLGILNPERWHCRTCHTTESVWACLSCTNFACGRYISEHALQHFQTTKHPLCIEVNEKFVFCYLCDDFVLNDNAPGDIKLLRMALDAVAAQNFDELYKQRRGRRILRYHIRDAKKATRRLLKADDIQTAVARHRFSRLSWAIRLWWSHYIERRLSQQSADDNKACSSKKRSVYATYPAAFTGLRNLGNTCYVNSVLQVLRHTAPFANFIMSHAPHEILPQSRKRHLLTDANAVSSAELTEKLPCKRLSLNPSSSTSSSSSIIKLCGSPQSTADQSSVKKAESRPTPTKVMRVEGDKVDAGGLSGGQSTRLNYVHCTRLAATTNTTVSSTVPAIMEVSDDPTNAGQPPASLYTEIYNVFRLLWSGQRTVISPSSLLYTIWEVIPTFKGYRQQDAQEFISLLLDRLQSELYTPRSGSNFDASVTGTVVPVNARDFINRTFQGHSVSHIRCSTCHKVTCTEEAFSELSLALPPACYNGEVLECSLVDLLQQYVSPSPIDGQGYACRTCNGTVAQPTDDAEAGDSASSLSLAGVDSSNSPIQYNSSLSESSFTSLTDSPKRGSPLKIEKLVSVSLARLSPSTFTATWTAASTRPLSNTSGPSSSSSSSIVSASPSLTSLDDFDETAALGTSLTYLPGARKPQRQQSPLFPTVPLEDLRKPLVAVVQADAGVCVSSNSASRASELSPATQTIRLARLPRVLRLHIKRFRWIGKQREKVGCHVSFPLILDLADFMLSETDRASCRQAQPDDPSKERRTSADQRSLTYCQRHRDEELNRQPNLYHLTGVIVHYGRGFQSGHYTAYCLNDQPECWLNCNDVNVSVCDFSEVAASQAYLLFYSELVPSSPFPTWFNDTKYPSVLRRCSSSSLCPGYYTAADETKLAPSLRSSVALRRIATASQLSTSDTTVSTAQVSPKPNN